MSECPFEIVRTTTGAISIRNKVVNEIMHNPVGPWREANSLYIEQSQLKEKLSIPTSQELVIFDVGLGAAANALAALHAATSSTRKRPLRIISFERDLNLLSFALREAKHFEHFCGYEKAIQQILNERLWSEGDIHWELRHGDFLEFIEKEKYLADVIFYDPYSPQVNSDMWTLSCFRKLRKKSSDGALLLTYSKATPIRTALLCADFFVGAGRGSGEKDETTLAAVKKTDLPEAFHQRWFERWQKSSVPYPLQTLENEKEEIRKLVCSHPQFL